MHIASKLLWPEINTQTLVFFCVFVVPVENLQSVALMFVNAKCSGGIIAFGLFVLVLFLLSLS